MIPAYFIRAYKFKKVSPTRCSLEVEKNEAFICICKQLYTVKKKNKIIPVYKVIWENESFVVFELKKQCYMIEETCIKEIKEDIKKIIMED